MTLPDERYRAIQSTQEFLRELILNKYPRTPRAVRERAMALLRHYPSELDLWRLAAAAPDVVQQHMDPLHRMVLAHEHNSVQQQDDDHEGSTVD